MMEVSWHGDSSMMTYVYGEMTLSCLMIRLALNSRLCVTQDITFFTQQKTIQLFSFTHFYKEYKNSLSQFNLFKLV